MVRNALTELEKWNKSKNRKPLMVWGARQVGKTYLVKELFADFYYKDNYIYIDYKIEDDIRRFCEETANPQKIIEFISLYKKKNISDETLLIFDEIQECPNIISALKYFCQDFRSIPVIATGSMVRIQLQRETHKRGKGSNNQFLFPIGKIQELTVYPMSFDEFLMNSNIILYGEIEKNYSNAKAVHSGIHELAMEQMYRYLLVGGMPEAVDSYIKNEDTIESLEILKSLYDNYLADMELYQASREAILRSRAVFSNIYNELNKENKNFVPGQIEKGRRTRDFETAIQWLTTAHVLNQSFQLKEHLTTPLLKNETGSFRLFLGDMGMFSYQSGINAASFISKDGRNVLSGIFFENYVASELVAKGNKLFYWKSGESAEMEFVAESNNKIYPIDVKKGRGKLNSLKKFGERNRFEYAIKVSQNNFGYNEEQRILTVPFYYFPFLSKAFSEGSMPSIP